MASSQRVWTIIPAAGASSRFAAYGLPKPMLRIEYNGRTTTMLGHALAHLPKDNVRIGLPPSYVYGADSYTVARTYGQADTCLQLLDDIPDEDSVIISDCDVILQAKLPFTGEYSVELLVTETSNPSMSYVDQYPFATHVVEKKVISPWGIVGVRRFANVGSLRTALERALLRSKGEVYLSEAISLMNNKRIFAHNIGKHYLDWGTPETLFNSGAKLA